MTSSAPVEILRRFLLADAAISGATGVLMLAGAGVLAAWLGLPEALMRWAGLVLIPFALGVLLVARAHVPSRPRVLTVIALNLAWAIASVLLLAAGWIQPTALGIAFVLFQAVVVAGFAELQYAGLRRAHVSA